MMASNLKGILPRSPSPRSSSPNSGPRSDVTHFIRLVDTTPRKSLGPTTAAASATASGSVPRRASHGSIGHRGDNGDDDDDDQVSLRDSTFAPSRSTTSLRRPSFGGSFPCSTGYAGRRSIAHSFRALGVDDDDEALAMSQLKNGKVDVSWPEIDLQDDHLAAAGGPSKPLHARKASIHTKGKARANEALRPSLEAHGEELFEAGTSAGLPDADEMHPLADIDLEQGGRASAIPRGSHDGRLYSHKSTSRAYFLRGFGLGNGGGDWRPLAGHGNEGQEADDDEDENEGAEAGTKRSTYFMEFGSGTAELGKLGSPDGFEAVTARESIWMWLSVVLASAIWLVAMLISTDVIDWPGDGLGKN